MRDIRSVVRMSAAMRTELVGLGMAEERGVPPGPEAWEGVVAGVGDPVQARRNYDAPTP